MSTYKCKEGDEVRLIATGQIGVLTDINPNTKAQRKNMDEYWAEGDMGDFRYFEIMDPKDIVLERRAGDIPGKKMPTIKELVDYISSAMHSAPFEEIKISETDTNEPEGQLVAYGTSATGQRFGCRITVSEIDWADC